MADDTADQMTPSGDVSSMTHYWDMVEAIIGGAETMRATLGARTSYAVPGPANPVANLRDLNRGVAMYPQSPYLPAFPNESYSDYDLRRRHAPFTNIYEDVADNLSAKPFAKELALDEKEPGDLQKLSEDIDGQGHSLHVFAKDTFRAGLDFGYDWILVDYTKVPPGATLADERAMGARPYWVRIQAKRLLAVYSAFVGGKETIYHARIHEPVTVTDGYGEECVDRVRVLNREVVQNETGEIIALGPATWEVYEKQEEKDEKGKVTVSWVLVSNGSITIGIIPLVPFIPVGRIDGSWRVKPAFHDIAYMQVEEFQQESNLKSIKELTAFPMLSGNGVTPPTNAQGEQVTVPVGPRGVLFAPMGGDGRFGNWTFIEPTAQSLTFLQTDLEKQREEMRNLGRQPLSSANLTVITTANVSMKAHSAVQAWALLLKDALEQAWAITCMWLGRKGDMPVVNVHMDFAVDFEAGTELTALQQAEASGTISKRLHFEEMKRRGVLSDDADWDDDQAQSATEQEGQQLKPEKMIDPVTGQPLVVTPTHGVPSPPTPPNQTVN